MSTVLSIRFPCRAIASLADEDRNLFVVGTATLRNNTNEVHIIEYNDKTETAARCGVFSINAQILSLSPSLADPTLCFCVALTVEDGQESRTAVLLRLPTEGYADGDDVEQVVSLECTDVLEVLWEPSGKSEVAVLTRTGVVVFAIDGDEATEMSRVTYDDEIVESGGGSVTHGAGAWSPHHDGEVATGIGSSVAIWDTEAGNLKSSISDAHVPTVRSVAYNPNKLYQVMTSGDDCSLKFWNCRNEPVLIRVFEQHSHWVWTARYNKSYEQLVLTGSSDTTVNLWNVSSIAAAANTADEDAPKARHKDGVVQTFTDHADSVYSVAWSAGHAWCFGSLSYDGGVVFNKVSKDEKKKILS